MQVMFWDIWIMQILILFFCVLFGLFCKKTRIHILLIQLFIIILSCNLYLKLHLSYTEYPCFTVYRIFLDFSYYYVYENNFWLFCEKHGFLRIKSYYEAHDDVT